MALGADPAVIWPHTTDTPLRTSTRRDRTAGTLTAIWASAKTRSSVRCGRDVWPPRPDSSIRMVSEADVMAPIRVPTLPTSMRGSQCSARILGTPSSTPCSMHACAPPGMVSSAGWKMIRTVAPRGDSWCMRCNTRAMPSMVVVCTSWPHAWVTPWFLDDGGGVDVAAQRCGDGAFADIHGQAGAFEPAGAQPGGLQPLRKLVGSAELLEGQLRVRMQVPPEFDQFRQERFQPRRHQGGGLGFSSVIAHCFTLAIAAPIRAIH